LSNYALLNAPNCHHHSIKYTSLTFQVFHTVHEHIKTTKSIHKKIKAKLRIQVLSDTMFCRPVNRYRRFEETNTFIFRSEQYKKRETHNHEIEDAMVFQNVSSSPVSTTQHHKMFDVSAAPL
jgi:hypothetical protein